ncbi:MAG: hypothetical protein V1656_03290, partial [Candidatus Jorgensenbacteria bacterium]
MNRSGKIILVVTAVIGGLLLTTHYSLPTVFAFMGPSSPAGSGGGLFNVDASQNIGFGTTVPKPVGTFDDASSSLAHGYTFTIASTTNPGLSIKNLSSGFSYLWSSKNDGSFQLYREKYSDIGAFPGKTIMVVSQYGNVGFPGNAYSYFYPTERLEVGGNIKASAFGMSGAGNVIASGSGSGSCMGFSSKGNLVAYSGTGTCNVASDGNVVSIGGSFIGSGVNLTSIDPLDFVAGSAFAAGNYAVNGSFAVGTTTTTGLPTNGLYVKGNVGIGTATPYGLLSVLGSNSADVFLGGQVATVDSAGDAVINVGMARAAGTFVAGMKSIQSWDGVQSDYTLKFQVHDGGVGDVTAMTINNVGNVGIGTTAPALRLQVEGAATGMPATSGTTQNGIMRLRASGSPSAIIDFGQDGAATGNAWIQSANKDNLASNYPLLLNPNGGNVGIATTTPASPLTVVGAIRSTSGGFIFPDATTQTTASVGGGGYWTLSGSNVYPTSTAYNVGIGTTSPDQNLHVQGNEFVSGKLVAGTGTYTVTPFNESPYIFAYKNDVSGVIQTSSMMGIEANDQDTWLSFLTNSSYDAGIVFGDTGNAVIGKIAYDHGTDKMQFSTNGSIQTTIDSSGNVGIGTSGPGALLNLSSNGGGDTNGLRLTNTAAGGGDYKMWVTATANGEGGNKLIFNHSGSAAQLVMDSSGNVGIATTTPAKPLSVAGDVLTTGDLYMSSTKSIRLDSAAATTLLIGNYNTGGFTYGTGAGTASLAVEGDVKGNRLCFGDADCQTSWSGIVVAGGGSYWTLSGSNVYPTSTAYNVGIGTTAPGAKLHIKEADSTITQKISGVGQDYALFYNGANSPDYGATDDGAVLNLGTRGGTPKFLSLSARGGANFATTGGNVGIATTTPAYGLTVVGTGYFSSPVIVGTPTAASHAATKDYVDS